MSEIKYGTIDRYFSDKNEKRVGRLNFFLRVLFVIIMVGLLVLAINMWLFNIIGLGALYISPITVLIGSALLMFSLPVLARKRSHDFNNDGKIFSYIILGSLIVNFLLNIYTLYIVYSGSLLALLEPNTIIQTISYISRWLGITSLVIFIFLLFRPRNIGSNNYGDDSEVYGEKSIEDLTRKQFNWKDRYFSVENEKRIWRLSFLRRTTLIFIPWILALIILSPIRNGLGDGFGAIGLIIFASPFVLLGFYPILSSLWPLIKKRSHDFNKDGIVLRYIILSFVMIILMFIFLLLLDYVSFRLFGSFRFSNAIYHLKRDFLDFIFVSDWIQSPILTPLKLFLIYIVYLPSLLLSFLILCLRVWNSWINNYGYPEDTSEQLHVSEISKDSTP